MCLLTCVSKPVIFYSYTAPLSITIKTHQIHSVPLGEMLLYYLEHTHCCLFLTQSHIRHPAAPQVSQIVMCNNCVIIHWWKVVSDQNTTSSDMNKSVCILVTCLKIWIFSRATIGLRAESHRWRSESTETDQLIVYFSHGIIWHEVAYWKIAALS